MKYLVGCDLGGTNIKAGVVDVEAGKVILSKSAPTLARELHDAVMVRMAALINEVIAESGVDPNLVLGIGVSAPGVLDLEKGLTLFLPNLPGQWRGVPLVETLSKACGGRPVSLLNDVRAITLGEYTFGAGRGVETIACYAIGTGIGGGIVVNGKLVLGIGGTGGELGHQTIDINGPRCGCGNNGCVEAYATAPAIASAGVKAVQQGLTTKIADLCDYDLNKITPKLIAEAAEMGDEIANQIYQDAGHAIGTGIANTMVTIGPRKVVLSGGVAASGDLLLAPIRETIEKRVFVMPKEEVEVVIGELGSDAGILGMAEWASQQLEI